MCFKLTTSIFILLLFLISCEQSNKTNLVDAKSVTEEIDSLTTSNLLFKKNKTEKEEELEVESSRLRFSGGIKRVEMINNKAIIEYVKNYDEYLILRKGREGIGVTKEFMKEYWGSGDGVIKALNDGSVRIMRNLDFIEETEIILPAYNKNFTINVTKKELQDFLGLSIEDVRKDWEGTYYDEFVYTKKGRDKFFNKFGKIK